MRPEPLTLERLRELLEYDPETGLFTVLASRGAARAGKTTAGSLTNHGYRLITVDYRRYMAHRLAWFYMTGEWPAGLLDHEDRNRSNNKWRNLRPATHSENGQNSTATYHRSGDGFRGVTWRPNHGAWHAHIQVDGRQKFLGSFPTPEQASAAYEAARMQFHPFYQPTNESS